MESRLMPVSNRRKSLFLLTAAAGALCASGALAQTTPDATAVAAPVVAAVVDDVVVTARRTSERAQDVPIALSALSGPTLAKVGAYTLADLQNNTPNLVAYNSNPRNSSVGIRGIGVSSAADGLDTSVGVYVDDVYLGRPGMALEDMVDIDRVEVLRGPQGTLFGRNSSAGVLNIATKGPSFNFGGTVEASGGNYDYNQFKVSLTGPLIKDLLAFRLTAFATHRSGYLTNTTTGLPGNSVGRNGGRLQFLLTPNDKVSVRLIGEYSNESDTCCVSSIKQVLSPGITSTTARTLTTLSQLGYTPVASFLSTRNNSPQKMRTDQHAASAEVNWDLGFADFTSITAYRYWHFDPLQDSDGTPLDVIQVNVAKTHDEQYSQEFRLASKPGQFSWQAGVYLFDQDLHDHYILNQFGADASAFYTAYLRTANPNAAAVHIAPGSQYIGDTHATTRSAAIFGQANYKVTDKFTITAGLRYTYDDKHGVSDTSTVGTPYAATSLPFHYIVTVDQGNVSWLVSGAYKLTRDSLLYASYSTGYKSAGLNLNSAVTAGTPLVLQPEEVGDWEVGLKQQLFDRRLTLNIDGYWTDLSGLQANIYPTNGAKSYLANVGKVLARGVEVDAALKLDNGIDLSVNGSYNDAHYTSYKNGPCPVGIAGVCNLTGEPVYESPRWIVNATVGYHFDYNSFVQPYVLAQYSYRSDSSGTVDDGPLTRIAAYSLVNARVGASLSGGKYDVSLWVNNAFNTHYFQNLGTSSIPGAGTFAIAGQIGTPQTFGATVRASF
jgi:iron complex outermembrane receptor protein